MKFILYLIIFIISIITYIHVLYHLKKSNEYEVYDIDYINVNHLNDICNLRQPFTFTATQSSIPIKWESLVKNMELNIIKKSEDNKSIYSEHNHRIVPHYKNKMLFLEKYIKPDFNITCIYDIIFSNENMTSELTHTYNYRNFYHVTEGNITIRFFPPDTSSVIEHTTDFETLNERSSYDIWNNKSNKFVEINAKENDIIFIPPYWWYSIKCNEQSCILVYKYRTFMNNITILPQLLYSYIAIHNKKSKITLKKHKKIKKQTINSK